MIVVADTSPINYIVQIKLSHILQRLYGELILPPAVVLELRHKAAPESVRCWAEQLPEWVLIRVPQSNLVIDARGLGAGELEAIALAQELKAPLLLVDERKARQIATVRFNMATTGTLGILRDAHRAGYIDGVEAFRALCTETNFRYTSAVETAFIAQLRNNL